MTFDWTINAGNVLTGLGILLAGVGIWVRQDRLLTTLIAEVRALTQVVEKMDEDGTSYSHNLAERVTRVEARTAASQRS